ncbi:MAG: ATP-binding protein [Pseudomonadota bacterium]
MTSLFSPAHGLKLNSPVRWLLPVVLVLLFLAILLWLPWQARQMESTERQEQLIADTLWVEQTIRFQMTRNEENLAGLGADIATLPPAMLHERMRQLLKNGRELQRVLWLDAHDRVLASSQGTAPPAMAFPASSAAAAEHARNTGNPQYSQPLPPGEASAGAVGEAAPVGLLMDYHLPLFRGQRYLGSLVATYQLSIMLDDMVPWWFAKDHQISLIDRDDRVLARRAAAGPGRRVYTHQRALDLPGTAITLYTDSVKSAPRLLPNLLVGSVIGLSLCLLGSLLLLWRHISRRLEAEGALRQQMSFRTAMENSLSTGLRARDLDGRVTYVNAAFCQIVGYPADEVLGKLPPMPYWAPEAVAECEQRFASLRAGDFTPQFETLFQRADGLQVPVLVFEAPLVDHEGRHAGWMSSVLDISERKRIEELNRQQQEMLQNSARLATMGEIASMLAHELNQPLAAISSYTAGALNMIGRADSEQRPLEPALLKPALEQAGAQAQRAGRIIRSVHQFVKKRAPERRDVAMPVIVDGIRSLIDLQARQWHVAVQIAIPADLPEVHADRMLVEQVLLNLTRNAIEAMQDVAPERRVMCVRASVADSAHVTVAVADLGHGIDAQEAARLFSPFYSTKAEGMGMGLNICRTAIEFHGGQLRHHPNRPHGTVFTFTLPVAVPGPTHPATPGV